MAVSLIAEVSNFIFYGFVVCVISAGMVAASVRFAGILKNVIQGQ